MRDAQQIQVLIENVRTAFATGTPLDFESSINALNDPGCLATITTTTLPGAPTLIDSALSSVKKDNATNAKNKILVESLGSYMSDVTIPNDSLIRAVRHHNIQMQSFLLPYYFKKPSELVTFWGQEKANRLESCLEEVARDIAGAAKPGSDAIIDAVREGNAIAVILLLPYYLQSSSALKKFWGNEKAESIKPALKQAISLITVGTKNAAYILKYFDKNTTTNPDGSLSASQLGLMSELQLLINAKMKEIMPDDLKFLSRSAGDTSPILPHQAISLPTTHGVNTMPSPDQLPSNASAGSSDPSLSMMSDTSQVGSNDASVQPVVDPLVERGAAFVTACRQNDGEAVRSVVALAVYGTSLLEGINAVGANVPKSIDNIKMSIALLESLSKASGLDQRIYANNPETYRKKLNEKQAELRRALLAAIETAIQLGMEERNWSVPLEELHTYYFRGTERGQPGYDIVYPKYVANLEKLGLNAKGEKIATAVRMPSALNLPPHYAAKPQTKQDDTKLALEAAKKAVGDAFVNPNTNSDTFTEALRDFGSKHNPSIEENITKMRLAVAAITVQSSSSEQMSLLKYAYVHGIYSADNHQGINQDVFTVLTTVLGTENVKKEYNHLQAVQSLKIHSTILESFKRVVDSSSSAGKKAKRPANHVKFVDSPGDDSDEMTAAKRNLADAFISPNTTAESFKTALNQLQRLEASQFVADELSPEQARAKQSKNLLSIQVDLNPGAADNRSVSLLEYACIKGLKGVIEMDNPHGVPIAVFVEFESLLTSEDSRNVYLSINRQRITVHQTMQTAIGFAHNTAGHTSASSNSSSSSSARDVPPVAPKPKQLADMLADDIAKAFINPSTTEAAFKAAVQALYDQIVADARKTNTEYSEDDAKAATSTRLLNIKLSSGQTLLAYACEKGIYDETTNPGGINAAILPVLFSACSETEVKEQLALIEYRHESVKIPMSKYPYQASDDSELVSSRWGSAKVGAGYGATLAVIAIVGIMLDAYIFNDTKMHERLCGVAEWCWKDVLGQGAGHNVSAQHGREMIGCVGTLAVMSMSLVGAGVGAAVGPKAINKIRTIQV